MVKRESRVRILLIAAALLTGLMTLQVACRKAESPLPGAVYAKDVPVYPGATYIGTMGGHSSGSIGGPVSGESQSWFFKVSDPGEKVVEFYKKKLPGAKLENNDAGDQTFTLIPPGAEEGEHVQVIFRRSGDLQIHESLKPGKKQS